MKTILLSVSLLLTYAVQAQPEGALKAFEKYKIERSVIDSLNGHTYLAYPFNLKTTVVTDASKKEYVADYDPAAPIESRWTLSAVNGGSPSKADRKNFDKLHSEKIPPLRPDPATLQLVKDDGKELVVTCRYDPASMVEDNHFMEGALVTLYFDAQGKLTHATGEIAQPFKIKMFKAEYLRSNTTYQYMEAGQKYVPLREEINVGLRLPDTAGHILARALRKKIVGLYGRELQRMSPEDRQFTFHQIDLNGDHKKETFVGFKGSFHCTPGGCTALLFASNGKLLTRFSATEYPLIVLNSSSGGWRNLVVGTAKARPALRLMKWNGKRYPGNPVMQAESVSVPEEHDRRVFNFKDYEEQWFNF